MVKNSELKPTSSATKLIAETVSGLIESNGLSQTEVGTIVGKSQSYASLRIKGLKPWSTDDLDALAKRFGFDNAFGLLDKARGLSD